MNAEKIAKTTLSWLAGLVSLVIAGLAGWFYRGFDHFFIWSVWFGPLVTLEDQLPNQLDQLNNQLVYLFVSQQDKGKLFSLLVK